MKQIVFLGLLISLRVCAVSQGTYTYVPVDVNIQLPADTSVTNFLDKDTGSKSISAFEKELLYNINYVRSNPSLFLKHAVLPYLEAYPQLKPLYGDGLVATLKVLKPLGKLKVDARLVKIARLHAADIASHNVLRHESSDGTSTWERFKKIGLRCGSECINVGSYPNATEVLLSLLIDYGVQNLGHRKSLLNTNNSSVGMGAMFNRTGNLQYTVIDLGCE